MTRTATRSQDGDRGGRTRPGALPPSFLVGGIVLAALNLRPAVTSVGAVLRELQLGTGMSDTMAGVLTSLPVLAFGVVGLVGVRALRRVETARSLVVALLLLTAGLVARVAAPRPWLVLVGSAVALAGIAIANVLLPVAVKRWFPDRVGWATGLYAMALSLGTAAAAAATVPVAALTGGGWRVGLLAWAVPAVLALACWAAIARRVATDTVVADVAPATTGAVHRQPRAWALAVFFGTQSLAAYVAMGWLPTIYQDAGVGPTPAGVYLGIVMLLGAPVSIVLPVVAARRPDQRVLVAVLAVSTGAAYLGLMLAPATAPWLWAVLLGVGFGSFPLALTLIGLRASTTTGTTQLSTLTQGVGYLVAAAGPLVIGLVHARTGGWTWPLAILLTVLVPQVLAGLFAAAPGHLDGAPRPGAGGMRGASRT